MKTVSEMAREAGFFDETWRDGSVQVWISDMNSDAIYITEELERFAELVRADERKAAQAESEADRVIIEYHESTIKRLEAELKARGQK